ncbi:MAG: hypothetical protein V2G42_06380 [bacterium JZ-2024 1]
MIESGLELPGLHDTLYVESRCNYFGWRSREHPAMDLPERDPDGRIILRDGTTDCPMWEPWKVPSAP